MAGKGAAFEDVGGFKATKLLSNQTVWPRCAKAAPGLGGQQVHNDPVALNARVLSSPRPKRPNPCVPRVPPNVWRSIIQHRNAMS